MYLFLCFLTIFLYLCLRNNKNKGRAKRIYIIIMTLVLCLFSAIRNYGVGVDTFQYYVTFTNISNLSWNIIINDIREFFNGNPYISDPGFTLFTKLFTSILDNFQWYCFLIALVFISAIGRIVYKSVDTFAGYILCYGYYISLIYYNCPNNIMRQTLAMGILLWATIFIIEKKRYLYSILLIIIAITIHKSSIIGVIPIGLLYVQNTRLIYYGGLVLMPVIMMFGSLFVSFLALNSGSDRYLIYVGKEAEVLPIFYIIEMLIFYFIGLFSIKKMKYQHIYVRESYMCYAMAIALVSLLWVSSDMIRITYYFSIWGIPFVANCVQAVKKTLLKKIFYLIVLSLILGRTFMESKPYEFYWEKMELHDRYYRLNYA